MKPSCLGLWENNSKGSISFIGTKSLSSGEPHPPVQSYHLCLEPPEGTEESSFTIGMNKSMHSMASRLWPLWLLAFLSCHKPRTDSSSRRTWVKLHDGIGFPLVLGQTFKGTRSVPSASARVNVLVNQLLNQCAYFLLSQLQSMHLTHEPRLIIQEWNHRLKLRQAPWDWLSKEQRLPTLPFLLMRIRVY